MSVSNPTLAAPDDDPYLWLEEVDGVPAIAWADEQTARTLDRFGNDGYRADRDVLHALLDRPDNLPIPARRAGLLYNFWKDATHPRGVWRRTTPESFRLPQPAWDVLIDLDAVALAEGEDWVWMGAATRAPEHDRAIVQLSRGGGDAVVLREFDLAARRFVADGYHLPEAKGGAVWVDRDTLLLSSAGQGATTSGYAATVRPWHRGHPPGEPIFRVPEGSLGADGRYERATGRFAFTEYIDFFNARVHVGTIGGPTQLIDLPTDVTLTWRGDWAALRPRSPWTVGGRTYAADTVLGIGTDALLAGARDFAVVFEPAPRRALQGMGFTGGGLLITVLDELRPVFLLARPSARPAAWTVETLTGLPDRGTASAWQADSDAAEADGTLLATVQDPLTPPTLLLVPPGPAAPVVLKRSPAAFDTTGLVVTRHEAVSEDGERISYTQAGPPGETGDAPVHLTGYGGFRVAMLPSYGVRLGKLWLERGGTTVLANIRGGGEFGTRWHEAGRREGKRLSHADFAAVAADLVRRGVTRPGRIAAEGGSNGGLLIANMLTRYPDRFGALFCTIPLIDMRRYTKLLAGASWVAEYGDPAVPGDWAFLGPLSAYHAAVPGRAYPPILLATARRDDRVHPGHARKMAAKLQAMGYDAHFYEPGAGGHGYGKDNREVAAFSALGLAFLRQSIGWDHP